MYAVMGLGVVTNMEEEHRIQGSTSVDGADPVTASGDDVTGSETEFVTEDEAEHEEPVTSVTNEKPDTKVIRVNATDIERIMASGYDEEKPATVLHRLLDEVDELRHVKSAHAAIKLEHAALVSNIAELEASIEDLRSGAETEIIPGQQSFSLKDAISSLKDVCDDDAVCIKFAAKIMEEQAKAANSHLSREHDAEQKRLDREDKDKDRALKKELAESRANHDKDMTLIKKGMVKKEDLEDIVFLGQKNTSPADRLKNKKELAARQAAHEEDETGNLDPPGGDPDHD
jgi:hypothetical protein